MSAQLCIYSAQAGATEKSFTDVDNSAAEADLASRTQCQRPSRDWLVDDRAAGFPLITAPAGFTTEVWDRVRDGAGTRLVGPVAAQLPVGVDFIARPFDEAMLIRNASAYEAATHRRLPPPDFGPLPNEP